MNWKFHDEVREKVGTHNVLKMVAVSRFTRLSTRGMVLIMGGGVRHIGIDTVADYLPARLNAPK